MCVAIPSKILEINGNMATVDIGDRSTTLIDISLVEANVGDYLITNTGFAIRVLDEQEAKETLEIHKKIQEIYDD